MKTIQWIIAAAAIAVGMSAPASAAFNDPEIIIYRFPGVRDDGGGINAGFITIFDCINFSGVTENLRFVTRDGNAVLESNVPQAIPHLQTITAVTHTANLFHNLNLTTGALPQGTTAIAATSPNIVCTARLFDATGSNPTGGSPLRGIRFNPAPGSQE
jgi:hypothetical protein